MEKSSSEYSEPNYDPITIYWEETKALMSPYLTPSWF